MTNSQSGRTDWWPPRAGVVGGRRTWLWRGSRRCPSARSLLVLALAVATQAPQRIKSHGDTHTCAERAWAAGEGRRTEQASSGWGLVLL